MSSFKMKIEGVSIHSQVLGSATSNPPVILLHGLNDFSATWLKMAPLLARDRLVVLPDLPGHGNSDRPDASYTLSWYAKIMSKWLKNLSFPQVDLIGHSFGGGVAQMMLLESHRIVRRLGLISSGGLGRDITLALRLASIPFVIEHLGQPFMAFGTHLALTLARDGRRQEDIALLCAQNAKQGSARAFARTVRDIIDFRGQRRTYHQRIHEIAKLPPTMLFWGTRDSIIPVEHGRRMTENFAGIKLVTFEGCGHYLHYEDPERCAQEIGKFIRKKTLPGTKLKDRGALQPQIQQANVAKVEFAVTKTEK